MRIHLSPLRIVQDKGCGDLGPLRVHDPGVLGPELLQAVTGAAQEVSHPSDVVHQHDYVEVLVGARLLVEQSIDAQGFQQCIVSYPEFSCRDIEAYVDRALKKYYLSPVYASVVLKNALSRNGWRELRVIARSGQVFLRYLARSRGTGR